MQMVDQKSGREDRGERSEKENLLLSLAVPLSRSQRGASRRRVRFDLRPPQPFARWPNARQGAPSRRGFVLSAAAAVLMWAAILLLDVPGATARPAKAHAPGVNDQTLSCADSAAIPDPEDADLVGDCNLLLAAKAILDPDAPAQLNWSVARPISEWDGVAVKDSRVTGLSLGGKELPGTIPAGLGGLTGLEYLFLNGLGLEGEIPAALGSLTNLKRLALANNRLNGQIPAALGNLVPQTGKLEWLQIAQGNRLCGSIPERLRTFSLDNPQANDLNGTSLPAGLPACPTPTVTTTPTQPTVTTTVTPTATTTPTQPAPTQPAATPTAAQAQQQPQGPLAVTRPALANLRTGPGEEYDLVATVAQGTPARIIGIGAQDRWLQVRLEKLDRPAWILRELTTFDGSLAAVRRITAGEIAIRDALRAQASATQREDDPPQAISRTIVNVRTGPGVDYDLVATVPQETPARIIGLGPQDEWYLVEIDGVDAPVWLYRDLTELVGSLDGVRRIAGIEIPPLGGETAGAAPLAITQPALLRARSGPGAEYEVVATVPQGTSALVIGVGPQNKWYQVELDGLDEPAWLHRELTELVGPPGGIRRIAASEIAPPQRKTDNDTPLAITQPAFLSVRSGPGPQYDVVTTVPHGTRAGIIGIDPHNSWYLVELDGLDSLTWILKEVTALVGPTVGIRQISETEIAQLPIAITQPAILNVRAGPGVEYGVVHTVPQGTWARIVDIDPHKEWYQVELTGWDEPAWIFRDLTHLVGPLDRVSRSDAGESLAPAPAAAQQPVASSITVELSLPSAGGVDLDVSWTDADTCTQVYSLYFRANADSEGYFSLESAIVASTANSKRLHLSTMPENALISAWCGTNTAGRQVAEVQIDPDTVGAYSSTPPQPAAGAQAGTPLAAPLL